MVRNSLRKDLREGTADIHLELDFAVGTFDTQASYVHFLEKTHQFRSAIERAAAGQNTSNWQIDIAAQYVAADLADCDAHQPAPVHYTSLSWTPGAVLGLSYVLEGSSLGARVLAKRTAMLGWTAENGARYLWRQAADQDRWRRFLAVLEEAPDSQREEVLAAARQTFAFALKIYA